MDPNVWSEVNDSARTVIGAVQAFATLRRPDESPQHETEVTEDAIEIPGASTEVPSVPRAVRGRDDIVGHLIEKAEARGACPPQVLAGAGGVGKSTIARLVATRLRDSEPARRVWWVSAANEDDLSSGLVSVARDLGASRPDLETIRSHPVADLTDIADRVWQLLERGPRWILVIDNADDPDLLGPHDGTGWVRGTRNGLLLITTRNGDEARWPEPDLIPVRPLSSKAAAGVLTDLAPGGGDEDAAIALADRLGCLPLALHTAGVYMRQEFVSWHTFDDYRHALDAEGPVTVIGASERPDVTMTWELSLDALAGSGRSQSRPLMWLLSCFAPGTRVPEALITAADPDIPLAALLANGEQVPEHQFTEFCMAGLRGLRTVGLVQRSAPPGEPPGIELHPFISEVTRSVMELSDPARTGIDPQMVRECAVAAVQAALNRLDPGDATHWPHFRVLTPHVMDLLTNTAPHLGMRPRTALLDAMARCIDSYIWSRAEPRAEQLAIDALTLASQLATEQEPVYQRLRHMHALSLRQQDRLAEAETLFREILAEFARMPGGTARPDALRVQHDLAWAIGRQGDWAAAEKQFLDVLRLRRQRREQNGQQDDDADIMHSRCMMGWSIGKQGRWAEAERDYRQLAADRAMLLGPRHADTLDTRENIGKSLAWQGNWAEAMHEWNQLAELRAEVLAPANPDTLRARQLAAYAAGILAQETGNRDRRRKAAAALREVLNAQKEIRGENHKETRETRALLMGLGAKPLPDATWPEDLPQPPSGFRSTRKRGK